MLAAQRRRTSPMAELRRLSAFDRISVLAMVGSQVCCVARHQVREHC
jgi:hypothetical protein